MRNGSRGRAGARVSLGEHDRHLTLGGAVNAGVGPSVQHCSSGPDNLAACSRLSKRPGTPARPHRNGPTLRGTTGSARDRRGQVSERRRGCRARRNATRPDGGVGGWATQGCGPSAVAESARNLLTGRLTPARGLLNQAPEAQTCPRGHGRSNRPRRSPRTTERLVFVAKLLLPFCDDAQSHTDRRDREQALRRIRVPGLH